VSRKTREDGVNKSFLFEPSGEFIKILAVKRKFF